jgi:hypothetical protein
MFNMIRPDAPCRDCDTIITNRKPNQLRCWKCIEANPGHGAHEVTVGMHKAIGKSKKVLESRIIRWQESDGIEALRDKFPDIYEKVVKGELQ